MSIETLLEARNLAIVTNIPPGPTILLTLLTVIVPKANAKFREPHLFINFIDSTNVVDDESQGIDGSVA